MIIGSCQRIDWISQINPVRKWVICETTVLIRRTAEQGHSALKVEKEQQVFDRQVTAHSWIRQTGDST